MHAVFGPVPSKRLGRSLGIDPIPLKTCNWNCVYCQLGRTTPLCNERKRYVPRKTIMEQLDQALVGPAGSEIDWITIVGSGEPTLHSELGRIIREIKERTSIPLAVLTNGALLYQPRVRQELMAADAVLPSLDAGDAHIYHRINRPWPKLTYDRLISGLQTFSRDYSGRLWIEVMLVSGLNDSDEDLLSLRSRLDEIAPDEIHINIPTRPPAEPWVQPPRPHRLERAKELLGTGARIIEKSTRITDLSASAHLNEAILEIITRHPMEEAELCALLPGRQPQDIQDALFSLQESGMARQVDRLGKQFWSNAQSRYPEH